MHACAGTTRASRALCTLEQRLDCLRDCTRVSAKCEPFTEGESRLCVHIFQKHAKYLGKTAASDAHTHQRRLHKEGHSSLKCSKRCREKAASEALQASVRKTVAGLRSAHPKSDTGSPARDSNALIEGCQVMYADLRRERERNMGSRWVAVRPCAFPGPCLSLFLNEQQKTRMLSIKLSGDVC